MVVLALVSILTGGGFAAPRGSAVELLPNLRPFSPSNFSIATVDTIAGPATEFHRVLRFDGTTGNYGLGVLELRGEIIGANPANPVPAFQFVYSDDGSSTSYPAGQFDYHPEHGHWHWQFFATYEMTTEGGAPVGEDNKVTFCIIDITKIKRFIGPGQPSQPAYTQCGTNVQGISVGWADIYSANLFDQWIVIDGVPDGRYWVSMVANPDLVLRESNTADNRASTLIDIRGSRVRVIR